LIYDTTNATNQKTCSKRKKNATMIDTKPTGVSGSAPGPGTLPTAPAGSTRFAPVPPDQTRTPSPPEYAPVPETLGAPERSENLVDYNNDTRIAAETDADFRTYGVPILVIVFMLCFCAFAVAVNYTFF
jgi:hypothetical protein